MDNSLKKHILGYLSKGIRFDGRKADQFREIKIETDISDTAEGSAKVTMGGTIVMAGVKLSIEKPYPDMPDNGTMMIGTELLPMSSPEFEPGPPSNQSIEIARVTDRGIRESQAIDTHALCIKSGEKAWTVMVDIVSINDEGNLLDAAAIATMAALKTARFPAYDGEKIDYRTKTDKRLPLVKIPISITVYKIGDHFIVDPITEEEKACDARLTVASISEDQLCALQKGGDTALSLQDITTMIEIATEKAAELRSIIQKL